MKREDICEYLLSIDPRTLNNIMPGIYSALKEYRTDATLIDSDVNNFAKTIVDVIGEKMDRKVTIISVERRREKLTDTSLLSGVMNLSDGSRITNVYEIDGTKGVRRLFVISPNNKVENQFKTYPKEAE